MRIARFLLVATCLAAAPLHAQPKRLTAIEDQKIRDSVVAAYSSGNCVATPLQRNSGIRHTLDNSRCTLSLDDTPVNFYTFDGVADELFSVDLHANGPAYTNPRLVLIPPQSSLEKPPLLTGSQSLTVRWVVPTPARWVIAVGSADRSARGDYVLGLRSRQITSHEVPQQCTEQLLQCQQSVSAVMSRDSCAFDVSSDVYLLMSSPDHAFLADVEAEVPFGMYLRYRLSTSLGGISIIDAPGRNGHLTLPGTSDRNVDLWIRNANRGFYSASLSCSSPACARPIIVTQPADRTVNPNGHAELSLEVDATLPVKVEWVESDGTSWSGGPTFTTPAIASDRTYTATVTNVCGSVQSRTVTIHVDNTSRHRRVPH
jgi:hypothetical protein